jgi:hypothetical protein
LIEAAGLPAMVAAAAGLSPAASWCIVRADA